MLQRVLRMIRQLVQHARDKRVARANRVDNSSSVQPKRFPCRLDDSLKNHTWPISSVSNANSGSAFSAPSTHYIDSDGEKLCWDGVWGWDGHDLLLTIERPYIRNILQERLWCLETFCLKNKSVNTLPISEISIYLSPQLRKKHHVRQLR